MYFYSRYLIYSLSSLSLHHSHVHDVGRPIRALGRRSTMRDSRAPSSMSGVSVALALVSDPFIAFTSPMTSSLEPSLVASLAPRSRRYLCEAPLLGGWRPTSQPHSSSKDSTSLSDASAVNRRESSTQGCARATLVRGHFTSVIVSRGRVADVSRSRAKSRWRDRVTLLGLFPPDR